MTTAVRTSRARGPWHVVAGVAALAGWLPALAAIGVSLRLGRIPDQVTYWVMDLVVALLYGIAVLVLLPRTRHPAGWILAVTAWGCGVAALADVWVMRGADVAGHDWAYFARFWTWIPGLYATVAVLPFLVVDHRTRARRALVLGGASAAALATLPGLTVRPAPPLTNPTAVDAEGWQSLLRALGAWPDRTVTVIGAVAVGHLVLALRRGDPAQRSGVRWLLAGQVALVLAMAVFLAPVPPDHAELAAELSGALLLLAQGFLPAALLTLVLSRRLWGVDATVDRATLWTTMTVAVALGYLAVVAAAGALLPSDSGLATGLGVAAVGLAFTPARRLLQRRVDRLVYGTGADPAQLWSRFGSVPDEDLDGLAESLRDALRLGSVRIVPAQDEGSAPESAADDIEITLRSRGRTVGALLVRPRTGERLDRRTTRLLDQTASLVATVIDLEQANAALDAARSRLVDIRQEERRVLRRDLHDGLGPALAGIRLAVTAALNLRDRDAETADRMLHEVAGELQRRSEDIRRLSRSLLPPALDDGDLGTALRHLAERFTSDELTVTATVDADLDLPPSAQIALYHVASEAVLNVHRHAGASRCDVVLRQRPGHDVLLLVSDNGRGVQDAEAAGIGWRSMRERAAELGGSVEVATPESGGTRVSVRIPVVTAS